MIHIPDAKDIMNLYEEQKLTSDIYPGFIPATGLVYKPTGGTSLNSIPESKENH